MTETPQTPDPALAGAGLSATGKTADQFTAGQEGPGTTYGDPGGTGTADQELEEATSGEDGAAGSASEAGEDTAGAPA